MLGGERPVCSKAMKEHAARFRFYGELNDFLPACRKEAGSLYAFNGHPGIKDAIEAQGVPHTEVGLIVVNGRSAGFDYKLCEGDCVVVYSVFDCPEISPVILLREAPVRRTAFVLDVHLGKLARILRLLGFDALYRNDYTDAEIISIALTEHRILLTRDRRMLHDRRITHARWLHSVQAEEQACEVIRRFRLEHDIRCFARCPVCNGRIQAVDKETVPLCLEPLTRKYYSDFFQCTGCGKIYWKGSHYDRIVWKLEQIRASCLSENGC